MIDLEKVKIILVVVPFLTAIVVGLVQAIKTIFNNSEAIKRYAPAISVAFGLAIGLVFIEASAIGGLMGVIIGLAASGLWDFGKTTIAGK
jgi:hypothetical protein